MYIYHYVFACGISIFNSYLDEDMGSQMDTGTVVAVETALVVVVAEDTALVVVVAEDTALVVVVAAAADNVKGFVVVAAAAAAVAAVEAGIGANRRRHPKVRL